MTFLACQCYIPKTNPVTPSKQRAEERFRSIILEMLPPDSQKYYSYNIIKRKARAVIGNALTDQEMTDILDAIKSEWHPSGQPEEYESV